MFLKLSKKRGISIELPKTKPLYWYSTTKKGNENRIWLGVFTTVSNTSKTWMLKIVIGPVSIIYGVRV